MRRIKASEGGVVDSVTQKMKFPSPPDAGILEPSLLNSWQEELAVAIEAAGITLDETKNTQLRDAMKNPHPITNPIVLTVGTTDYPTIQSALDSLYGRYIAPNIEVTISVPTDIMLDQPIRSNLIQGNQVTIKGRTGRTTISIQGWTPTADESFVKLAHKTGLKFEDLYFNFPNTYAGGAQFYTFLTANSMNYVQFKRVRINYVRGNGIVSSYGSSVFMEDSEVGNCTNGGGSTYTYGNAHVADRFGFIYSYHSTNTEAAKNFGVLTGFSFIARHGGRIHIYQMTITYKSVCAMHQGAVLAQSVIINGSDDAYPKFYSVFDGHMRLEFCNVYSVQNGRPVTCYGSEACSTISAVSCTAEGATYAGFHALQGSSIYCISCTSNNNTGGTGFAAIETSYIRAASTSATTGNTTNFNPAHATNSGDLSRIA